METYSVFANITLLAMLELLFHVGKNRELLFFPYLIDSGFTDIGVNAGP
jgi:hypothetical protein